MSILFSISERTLTIVEPNLHDGHLLGIFLPAAGRVDVAVADLAGRQYCIALAGVTTFHASDFWEGNIILDVTVLRGKQVGLDDLAGLIAQMKENNIADLLDRIHRESLLVVQLCPSYGCYFVAVAGEISIWAMDTKAGGWSG